MLARAERVPERVEEHTQPSEGEYRVTRVYAPHDTTALSGLGETVAGASLLGA